MKETEFWRRMESHLGQTYAHVWSAQHNLMSLGGRTVDEAMRDGEPCKRIWHAVWVELELPDRER